MGTLTGDDILARAWIKAQDDGEDGPVRWKKPEGLLWLNDGQREIVNLVPSAYTLTQVRPLMAGPRQSLLGLGLLDGFQVQAVRSNYGVDLTTRGQAITLKDRKHFDEMRPEWMTEPGTRVRHYMLDPLEPEVFYVWPSVDDGAVELVYTALPPNFVTGAEPAALSDVYGNALQYFVLASFFLKDVTFTASPAKAMFYMQAFAQTLGIKESKTLMAAAQAVANTNAKGPTP